MADPRLPTQGVPLDVAFRGNPGGRRPGGISFPQADAMASVRAIQVWLPELYPIPQAQEFNLNVTDQSPGAGTISPAGLVFQLPSGCRGVIRVFTQGLDDMAKATAVAWTLKINEGPVPGYTAIAFFPGLAARVTGSQDCFIRVPEAGRISVSITNADGAAYQVGAGYGGWFWPIAAEADWLGVAR